MYNCYKKNLSLLLNTIYASCFKYLVTKLTTLDAQKQGDRQARTQTLSCTKMHELSLVHLVVWSNIGINGGVYLVY